LLDELELEERLLVTFSRRLESERFDFTALRFGDGETALEERRFLMSDRIELDVPDLVVLEREDRLRIILSLSPFCLSVGRTIRTLDVPLSWITDEGSEVVDERRRFMRMSLL
jgi:hypothetical protein